MKLIELQKIMQEAILEGKHFPENYFSKPARGDARERLQIYQDAYYLRLVGHLKTTYAVLQKYLGVEEFNQLIVSYLQANPSHYFSIRSVGSSLGHFIRARYPDHLLWAELAELEWALTAALWAEEKEPVSFLNLQTVSAEQWPELVFKLHPSVTFFQSYYNVPKAWHGLNRGEAQFEWRKCLEPYSYVIWCKQNQSYFLALNSEEKYLLDCIESQLSFAALCDFMSQHIKEEHLVGWISERLGEWIREEFLIY